MSTIRSEGQFNTIIYEEEDIYRKQTERWVVLMNAHDMRREGLGKQSRVTLKNNTGSMVDLKVCCCDIAAGNLLTYFPEANVLVPMDCDPRSKTPSFKSVQVELIK
jgi:anaerobic selenocysteine-containing dehydrogenase